MTELDFATIAEKVKNFHFPEVDFVVGVGKNGIIPAAMVAYHLDKDMGVIQINYRDEKNQPCHPKPVVRKLPSVPDGVKRVLLVDDASISGQTMSLAKKTLKDYDVTTFALKGRADLVLFPEIQDCVLWPWKPLGKEEKG